MRGLPALTRAVPAFAWLWLREPSRIPGKRTEPDTFMSLVRQLPPLLLERALTHSSWVAVRAGSYERLEFLGDSVLGMAIASALFERYPDREEGDMARIKAFVVSRASCSQVAEQLGVGRLILERAPAPEQKREEVVSSPSVLGNVLEALIGALYLAHGFEQTRIALVEAFEEQMRYAVTAYVDHKTALQESLASHGLHPEYRLAAEVGPPHARVFTSEVFIEGLVWGRGVGTTIKMSEQAAAREALDSLREGRRV